jgi:hypothetical protein
VWILIINDVIEDLKEGGVRAEELDTLFEEFALIAELRRECRLGLIAEFVDRFGDWTVGEKIGSVRPGALLDVAPRCLDGASEMAPDFFSRPSRPFLNPPGVSTRAVGDISPIRL